MIPIRRAFTVVALATAITAFAAQAQAQSVGIGPRFSFVRGDLITNTPATRLVGGSLRMMSSPHVALEMSLDFRSQLSDDGLHRTRETPIQGSLLLFPIRAAFAPYLLGGAGIYTQTVDTIDLAGVVTDTSVARKIGWHLGIGAEMAMGRHARIFADYRFQFVKFGKDAEGTPVPGSSTVGIKATYQGSMWASGLAFYF